MIRRRHALALVGAAAFAGTARAQTAELTQVATFEQQVTGVAVAQDGRVFVNFPRWEQDVAVSVGEVGRDGGLTPYPDAEWNAWRSLKPLGLGDRFVCVQSVTADPQGFLWIVDPAAPGNAFNLPGAPKLVQVDLGTNAVVRVIHFDEAAAPQGSYPNDLRVSPDGRTAFLTDSGRRGALLVVDVASGRTRRVLDGHPSTQMEDGVVVSIDGRALRRPDGRKVEFAADGIALDARGDYLYWQALTGRTLYRIRTAVLRDAALPPARVGAAVERVGTTGVSDGYWMDKLNRLYVSNVEDNAVRRRELDGTMRTMVQDPRLLWPDSFVEGPDGAIYVTSSQIPTMAQWHEKGSTRTQPYALWKFMPPA